MKKSPQCEKSEVQGGACQSRISLMHNLVDNSSSINVSEFLKTGDENTCCALKTNYSLAYIENATFSENSKPDITKGDGVSALSTTLDDNGHIRDMLQPFSERKSECGQNCDEKIFSTSNSQQDDAQNRKWNESLKSKKNDLIKTENQCESEENENGIEFFDPKRVHRRRQKLRHRLKTGPKTLSVTERQELQQFIKESLSESVKELPESPRFGGSSQVNPNIPSIFLSTILADSGKDKSPRTSYGDSRQASFYPDGLKGTRDSKCYDVNEQQFQILEDSLIQTINPHKSPKLTSTKKNIAFNSSIDSDNTEKDFNVKKAEDKFNETNDFETSEEKPTKVISMRSSDSDTSMLATTSDMSKYQDSFAVSLQNKKTADMTTEEVKVENPDAQSFVDKQWVSYNERDPTLDIDTKSCNATKQKGILKKSSSILKILLQDDSIEYINKTLQNDICSQSEISQDAAKISNICSKSSHDKITASKECLRDEKDNEPDSCFQSSVTTYAISDDLNFRFSMTLKDKEKEDIERTIDFMDINKKNFHEDKTTSKSSHHDVHSSFQSLETMPTLRHEFYRAPILSDSSEKRKYDNDFNGETELKQHEKKVTSFIFHPSDDVFPNLSTSSSVSFLESSKRSCSSRWSLEGEESDECFYDPEREMKRHLRISSRRKTGPNLTPQILESFQSSSIP